MDSATTIPPHPYTILLVASRDMRATGLRATLEHEPLVQLVGEVEVPDLIPAISRLKPDGVVAINDGHDEIILSLVRKIREVAPQTKLLIFSDVANYGLEIALTRLQAVSFVLWEDVNPASLARAQGLADGGSLPAGGCLAPGHIIAPPSGFNPLMATGAQLACYGFPARPSNTKELRVWEYYMAHAKIYAGGTPLSAMPPFTTTDTADPSYAGYLAPQTGQGLTNLKWYQAQADWTVPTSVTPYNGQIYDFPT